MFNLKFSTMRKKTNQFLMLALLIPLTIGLIMSGCKKDDDDPDPVPVTFTALDGLITDAHTIHDGAVEGENIGEYQAGSKAELQTAIGLAETVRNTSGVTQAQVDAAVVNLQAALTVFESKKITEIAPESLVAEWLMNGDATDNSGNGHNGELKEGYTLNGSGTVQPSPDRFGNPDYAYKFSGGGNIEVPTATAFNPPDMTIVTWIQLDETWAHNYFLSNDIWNCWKLQVQDANKPFFTRKILKDDGSGDNAWIDKDSNTGVLVNDEWTHIAVSYKSGEMTFFINGENVMFWDDFPTGTPVDPNPLVNLVIGQALPTGIYSDVPGDPYEWQEWLGYLKGSLDDLKIYNIVLTDAQVHSIYTWEKDNVIE